MVDETLRLWGSNIRIHREALGMSPADLAAKVEVRAPTVWRWEHGQMEPRRQMKARLAEALHTDVRVLFPMTRAAS